MPLKFQICEEWHLYVYEFLSPVGNDCSDVEVKSVIWLVFLEVPKNDFMVGRAVLGDYVLHEGGEVKIAEVVSLPQVGCLKAFFAAEIVEVVCVLQAEVPTVQGVGQGEAAAGVGRYGAAQNDVAAVGLGRGSDEGVVDGK